MSTLSSTIIYNDSGSFTLSDNSLIELTPSAVQLKKITYANETFFITYLTKDAERSIGSAIGTLVNGATVAAGELDCTGTAAVKHSTYSGVGNTDFLVGTIETEYVPNFTGNPGAQRMILSMGNAANSNSRLELRTLASATVVLLRAFDSSGTQVFDKLLTMGTSYTAGVPMHISLNYDFTPSSGFGARLYMNGILVPEAVTNTFVRSTSDLSVLSIGADASGSGAAADASFKNVRIWNTVQRTGSSFTLPSPVEAPTYSTANPFIISNNGIDMDALVSLSSVETIQGSDSVQWVVNVDGVDKYWDGAAWSNSAGFANSNTTADITTNGAALNISIGAVIKLKAFLHAVLGATNVLLSSSTVTYNPFSVKVSPGIATVFHYVEDNGVAISGAILKIYSAKPFVINGVCVSVNEVLTSNSIGYIEVDLTETTTPNINLSFELTYIDVRLRKQIRTGEIKVPTSGFVSLTSIIQ